MYNNKRKKIDKIFALFKTKNQIYQKDIEQLTGYKQPTIVRQLQQLKKEKLIKTEIIPNEGKGPGKNIVKLTTKGLYYLLQAYPYETEQILLTHSEKLLFAQKLKMFESINIKKEVINIFRATLLGLHHVFNLYQEKFPNDDALQEIIDDSVFETLLTAVHLGEKYIPMLKACKTDKQISAFFSYIFEKKAKQYEMILLLKKEWEAIKIPSNP